MQPGNPGAKGSDEMLVQRALQGDSASFGQLTARWEKKIFGFIWRYVGNREEARDLTQDTFAKAFENLGRLSDRGRFSAWLYTIALNECRMRFRRARKMHPVSIEEGGAEVRALQTGERSPEEQVEGSQQVARLKQAIEKLPEEQRVVILMKEYQGLKFHEIAAILGLPLSTAKSRMYLGLKTLKKLLEEQE